MPRESVTAKDVARIAGVSTATVCLSMRDDPRVSPRTRKRVQAISREMNYRPSAIARALVQGRTHTVGLVFSVLEFEKKVLITAYSRALETLTDLLVRNNYYLSLATWAIERDEAGGRILPRMFHESAIEALVLIQQPKQELVQILQSQRVPYVVLDGLCPDQAPDACSVSVDESRAAEMTVEHLVELGHRRIANLTTLRQRGTAESPVPSHRMIQFPTGYARAMSQAGLAAIPGWDRPLDGVDDRLEELWRLPEPPTALVLYDDQMAGTAVKWLMRRGLNVPDHVSVVALHDIGYAAIDWLPGPSITCKANMQREMATIVADKLMGLMDRPFAASESVVLPPRLMVRQSSGPCPTPA